MAQPGGPTASTIAVQLVSMLGVKPNVAGSIAFIDDGEIQYVCGRNLIRFDTESRAQRILQGTPELAGITAVATSPNRKLTAYAECGPDAQPLVIVYEWAQRRRKRTITGLDSGTAPVTHLSFTADNRHLVIQTGAPEWVCYYFAIERGSSAKLLATCRNVAPSNKAISLLDCHPTDSTLIAASGRGFFKLLRFADDALKPLQVNLKKEPIHFTCHGWLPEDRQVLGGLNGELWLLENGEFRRILADAGASVMATTGGMGGAIAPTFSSNKPIGCILPFSKGFVAGCEGGILKIFEKNDDGRGNFRHTRTFALGTEDISKVTGMSLSPNDDDIAITTAAGQIYNFKLSSYELFKPGDVLFRPLICSFHTHPAFLAQTLSASGANIGGSSLADIDTGEGSLGSGSHASGPNTSFRRGSMALASTSATNAPSANAAAGQGVPPLLHGLLDANIAITGIDICVRKPTFVTCSADRTVRIWNYAPSQGGDLGGFGGLARAGGGGGAGGDVAASSGITCTPTLDLLHRCNETPTSVALHPNGFHLLIGLETSLQVLNVLMDSVRVFKELPIRGCQECRFSNNGNMFAAVNGNVISVFGTYTCAPIVSLRAHSDRVVSFFWSKDDKYIVSVSRDGVIIRHAVVVPNSTTGSGGGGGSVPPSAGPVGVGGLGGAGGAGGAGGDRGTSTGSGGNQPGKPVNSFEARDIYPLAISSGAADSGREVIVAGVVMKSGQAKAVVRHIDIAAPLKDALKADVNLNGHVSRSLASIVGGPSGGSSSGAGKILLAGMGTAGGDRFKQAQAAVPDSLNASASASGLGTSRRRESIALAAGSTVLNPQDSERDAGGNLSVQGSQMLPASSSSASIAGAGNDGASTTGGGAAGAGSAAGGQQQQQQQGPSQDSLGCLRAYRMPPSNDYVESVCHAGPITKMVITPNNKAVITVGSDGTIALLAVVDMKPGGAGPVGGGGSSAAGTEEGLPWAEEVLVMRSDLEEVRKERMDLEARVQEIIMANKYNERYKDMTNDEKLKEVKEKFAEDLSNDRAKKDALRQSKQEMEAGFEDQLAELEAMHAKELEELEVTYRGKIQGEMERYDALVKDRDQMNEEFEAANAALFKEQVQAIEEVKSKYEAAISSEQQSASSLEAKKRAMQEDFASLADDIEADVDREMEEQRARYEEKLQKETKATLLLRGENGFMKRKFMNVNREMTEKKEALAALADKEKEFHEAIAALQKDVQGQKKEIREREETIADKESRIYDLKKKNQELEKFKFVLNYKIQELKRQILPRKREIQEMREQMKEMELELLQYHKSNAALDLMIGELKLKRDGVQRDVSSIQERVDDEDETLLKISRDVAALQKVMAQHPNDPKALLPAVTRLYQKYVHGQEASLAPATLISTTSSSSSSSAGGKGSPRAAGKGGAGATADADASSSSSSSLPEGVDLIDVQREFARQRLYLEKSLESIRAQMEKEEIAFRVDRSRLQRENMMLSTEINELRRNCRYLQAEVAKMLGGGQGNGSLSPTSRANGSGSGGDDGFGSPERKRLDSALTDGGGLAATVAGLGQDFSPPSSPTAMLQAAARLDITPAELAAASAALGSELNSDPTQDPATLLARILGSRASASASGGPFGVAASTATSNAPSAAANRSGANHNGNVDALDAIAAATAHLAIAKATTAAMMPGRSGPTTAAVTAAASAILGDGAAARAGAGPSSSHSAGVPPPLSAVGPQGSQASSLSSTSGSIANTAGRGQTTAKGGAGSPSAGSKGGRSAGPTASAGGASAGATRRSAAVFGVIGAPEGIFASPAAAALAPLAANPAALGALQAAASSSSSSGANANATPISLGGTRPGTTSGGGAGLTGGLASAGAEALRSKVAAFKGTGSVASGGSVRQ